MGMGTAPCAGYILPVTLENFNKLQIDISAEAKEYFGEEEWDRINNSGLDDDDYQEHIENFFRDCDYTIGKEAIAIIENEKFEIEIFYYDRDEGDRYDDLTTGFYFSFPEDVIFIKEKSPVGKALDALNLFPTFEQWTVFG